MSDSHYISAPNFTQIPNCVLDYWSLQLAPSAYIILLILCRRIFGYADKRKTLQSQLSYRDLEKLTGMSRKTVTDGLRKLEENNLIEVHRSFEEDGSPSPNLFSLLVHHKEDKKTLGSVPMPTHTQVPNCVLDSWLPLLKKGELLVYMSIIRHTLGYHKIRDNYSYDQIAKKTGLSADRVRKHIASLHEMGLIVKSNNLLEKGEYDCNSYEVAFDLEMTIMPSKKVAKRKLESEKNVQKNSVGVGQICTTPPIKSENYQGGVGEKRPIPLGEKRPIPLGEKRPIPPYKDIQKKTPTKEKITKENNTPKPPHSNPRKPEAKDQVLCFSKMQKEGAVQHSQFKDEAKKVNMHPELAGIGLTQSQQHEFASVSTEQIQYAVAILRETPNVRYPYRFLKAALEGGWQVSTPEEVAKANKRFAEKLMFENRDMLAQMHIEPVLSMYHFEFVYFKGATPADSTFMLEDKKFQLKIADKMKKLKEAYRRYVINSNS